MRRTRDLSADRQAAEDRVQGAGCRVQGAGCRVQGAGGRLTTAPLGVHKLDSFVKI